MYLKKIIQKNNQQIKKKVHHNQSEKQINQIKSIKTAVYLHTKDQDKTK